MEANRESGYPFVPPFSPYSSPLVQSHVGIRRGLLEGTAVSWSSGNGSLAFSPLLPKWRLIRSEGRAVSKWDGQSATQHSCRERLRDERERERNQEKDSGTYTSKSSVTILINASHKGGGGKVTPSRLRMKMSIHANIFWSFIKDPHHLVTSMSTFFYVWIRQTRSFVVFIFKYKIDLIAIHKYYLITFHSCAAAQWYPSNHHFTTTLWSQCHLAR